MLRLAEIMGAMQSVLVCYSGGIDSAFVLAVGHRLLGDRCVGMTAVSPSLAPFELEDAVHVAARIGARHELVDSNEINDESYAKNDTDRCFHCKSELYRLSEAKRTEWNIAHVLNGTNLDDLGDYRPGLEAARNAGVRSPLVEASLTKADVRDLSQQMGLPIWDKPAAACLSSRLPYGTRVTKDRLHQIGSLEKELRTLGIRQARVRWHASSSELHTTTKEATIARIEVGRDEMQLAFDARDAVVEAARKLGFSYVTLDLAGYRTGSHNEVLTARRALPIVQ